MRLSGIDGLNKTRVDLKKFFELDGLGWYDEHARYNFARPGLFENPGTAHFTQEMSQISFIALSLVHFSVIMIINLR